jgi:hypothetical protein
MTPGAKEEEDAMRLTQIALIATLVPTLAAAGALHAPTGEAPDYQFVGCAAPAEPDLSIDEKLRGAAYVAAHNARTRAFNAYIEGANLYLECLGAQAQRDLDAYYAAVNARLEAEQAAVLARSEALRAGLKAARR